MRNMLIWIGLFSCAVLTMLNVVFMVYSCSLGDYSRAVDSLIGGLGSCSGFLALLNYQRGQ